jgi:hypothetical protein
MEPTALMAQPVLQELTEQMEQLAHKAQQVLTVQLAQQVVTQYILLVKAMEAALYFMCTMADNTV